jgi:hypothetical protein
MSPALRELDRQTRAALAEASVMRRPYGPILQRATLGALRLEEQRRTRPSEVPRFFDGLTDFTRALDPPASKRRR